MAMVRSGAMHSNAIELESDCRKVEIQIPAEVSQLLVKIM